MRMVLFSMVMVGALILSGCVPPVETNTNDNDNTNASGEVRADIDTNNNDNESDSRNDDASTAESDDATADDTSSDDVSEQESYTNKAVGYALMHPKNWYWRHYIKPEIGSASSAQDIFVLDVKPLPGLGGDFTGAISINVLTESLETVADSYAGFTRSEATIGGRTAVKLEGMQNGQSLIVYLVERNNTTIEFRYTETEDGDALAHAFSEVIKSFSFVSAE